MNSKRLLSAPIWYKIEGHHANKMIKELPEDDFIDFFDAVRIEKRLPISKSTLNLHVKKEIILYTLNETIFIHDCQGYFSKLINIFKINKQNLIEVMLPDEYQVSAPSTSSQDSQAEKIDITYKSHSS
ncbi:20353_t:CDS:2 [Funneliformis geosporum]|uniref:13650_t:CDS:1 n=1 Tax=Funneliformis geosporum TaxID=1117311 RepID=A0A9W4X1N6_9GLOM|nr:13650_t:CDS:2 [Funneliformis geosporum]CAI2192897.1 20353_t:CDS:2 [Funneliformis geosporum]